MLEILTCRSPFSAHLWARFFILILSELSTFINIVGRHYQITKTLYIFCSDQKLRQSLRWGLLSNYRHLARVAVLTYPLSCLSLQFLQRVGLHKKLASVLRQKLAWAGARTLKKSFWMPSSSLLMTCLISRMARALKPIMVYRFLTKESSGSR